MRRTALLLGLAAVAAGCSIGEGPPRLDLLDLAGSWYLVGFYGGYGEPSLTYLSKPRLHRRGDARR